MTELQRYLRNCKVTQKRIDVEVRNLRQQKYPRRDLFDDLFRHSENFFLHKMEPRLIAVSGLRGVGKTTLLWQVAEEIFNKHTDNIYFINGNDINSLGYNLVEVINDFEQNISGAPLAEITEPVVFLFDEAHDITDWDRDLKILYDKCKNAFILCTGSSALLLHKNADLATRMTMLRLFPFSYPEYIKARSQNGIEESQPVTKFDIANTLKQTLFFSPDIKALQQKISGLEESIINYHRSVADTISVDSSTLITDYISYFNIARFLTLSQKELIDERIIALFERILFRDLLYFDKEINPEILLRLLMRIALSDEVNYQTLSRDFGKMEDIEHFIELLDKAEVLNLFFPYGGVKSRTGKNIKPFFMSPSLRNALFKRIYGDEPNDNLQAKLYEDIVAMYLKRIIDKGLLSFGYSEKGVSPDFIIETLDNPVVLEVGKNKKSRRQITKYERKKRYGIIVSSELTKYRVDDDSLYLPLGWFLLL